MKRKILSLATLAMIPFAQPTFSMEGIQVGEDFTFGYEAEVNVNSGYSSTNDERINLDGSFISMNVEYQNRIRAVLTAKLENLIARDELKFADEFDIQEFIQEAYIEVREVGGTPVAVVVGKHPIAFGQGVEAMPAFQESPLHELLKKEEVMGLTIDLTEGIFGIFDQVELSVFETGEGDLEIGSIDGVSVRASKLLTPNILATISHAEMGNGDSDTGHERRTSVGVLIESTDGMVVSWGEAILFSNNPQYPDAVFGMTGGVMVRVHESTDLVVEASYIMDELWQIAAGVRTNMTENISLGLEYRYTDYADNRENDHTGLITLTYKFGSSPNSKNETYLFGADQ